MHQSQPCPQKQDDASEQHGCHARDSQRARACTRTAKSVVDGVREIAIAMSNSVRESHRRRREPGGRAELRCPCASGSSVLFICSIAWHTRRLVPWLEQHGHVARNRATTEHGSGMGERSQQSLEHAGTGGLRAAAERDVAGARARAPARRLLGP